MLFKPVSSEKAVRMIEADNTLLFTVERNSSKEDIKREFEKTFGSKVERINVLHRKNTKYAYIKLKKDFKAIDVATKLGMI